MLDPQMVIIEGGSYALPLSQYLKNSHGFRVVWYYSDVSFTNLIDGILFQWDAPRICIVPGHLTALARKQITRGWFREFESAVALTGCKLILTTARDTGPSGYLAEPYAASLLEKMALDDGRELVAVDRFLGLEGMRRVG